MKKIKIIFFVIIILNFIGCYDPPDRDTQGLDYNSLSDLVDSSDRILKLKKSDKEIEFTVEEKKYFSFQFVVLEKFKGSSSVDDKIFITIPEIEINDLFISGKNIEKFDKNFSQDEYIFFLMGRSRKNIFPKELGGSLWYKNGNPSIFQSKGDSLNMISSKKYMEYLDNDLKEILEMSEMKFINLVKSLNE
ncbi:MAG: hypothetical protein ACJ0J5_00840 [Dehalococcoidia bacterium]|nr:MAG: hypothetical protein EVA32_05080 [Chloroflexota bacterium]